MLYTESDGHCVEVIVDYAGKGVRPANVIFLPSLSTWKSPMGEPIPSAKKEEIINKLAEYFGPENIRTDDRVVDF
jgi:hypothetical protein